MLNTEICPKNETDAQRQAIAAMKLGARSADRRRYVHTSMQPDATLRPAA